MMDLTVDPDRMDRDDSTGIYMRARLNGKMGAFDIATLDSASLLAFLQKDGGDNIWAENCVGAILGHNGPIRKP